MTVLCCFKVYFLLFIYHCIALVVAYRYEALKTLNATDFWELAICRIDNIKRLIAVCSLNIIYVIRIINLCRKFFHFSSWSKKSLVNIQWVVHLVKLYNIILRWPAHCFYWLVDSRLFNIKSLFIWMFFIVSIS